jgi:hypothetical protein
LWIALDTGHGWVWGSPGQWSDVGPIQGPPGATGAAGATGAQGPAGATGPPGATGAQGIKGDQGTPGTAGTPGAQGPKGDTGAQGAAGTPGAPGTPGAQGPQGIQGTQGPSGATGAQGPKGDTGATGATGAAGAPGATGATGPGVPVGGTVGQLLFKQSPTNYDLGFKSLAALPTPAVLSPAAVTGSASKAFGLGATSSKITPSAGGKVVLVISGNAFVSGGAFTSVIGLISGVGASGPANGRHTGWFRRWARLAIRTSLVA